MRSRRPRTDEGGGERFRPRRAAHVFKKLHDFALSTRNGPAIGCVTTSPPRLSIHTDGNSLPLSIVGTRSLVTLLLLAARFIRGTRLARPARAQLYGNYIRFYYPTPDIVRRRVIDRLFGDTRAARRRSSLSFYQCAFCKGIIIP